MQLPIDYKNSHWTIRREARQAYVALQQGRCWHCGGALYEKPLEVRTIAKRTMQKVFPEHFMRHPVHLHHDHDTGLSIGAVHAHCNAVLWVYEGE